VRAVTVALRGAPVINPISPKTLPAFRGVQYLRFVICDTPMTRSRRRFRKAICARVKSRAHGRGFVSHEREFGIQRRADESALFFGIDTMRCPI